MDYRGARADDRTLSDHHARPYEYICRNPRVGFDHDGCDNQRHRRVPVVVAGGAQVGVLTHRRMGTEPD